MRFSTLIDYQFNNNEARTAWLDSARELAMDLKLEGLNVAVTGASEGIGRAIAKEFANEGANISICSRDRGKISQFLDSLQGSTGRVLYRSIDVFDRVGFRSWIDETVRELGGLDIFVANVTSGSSSLEGSVEKDVLEQVAQFEVVSDVVKTSPYGAITYISSIAGSVATPDFPNYGVGKAAMLHYVKSLSKRYAPIGLRINSVSPGDVISPGNVWDKVKNSKPDLFKEVLGRNPRGTLGSPEEVARVVAFVASPAASLVNGANIIVDGASTDHLQV